MGVQVITDAQLKCDQGLSPCMLIATTALMQVNAGATGKTAATVMDYKMTNIPTFGMCKSMANPQVSSATTAAKSPQPVPQPCSPKIAAPWSPGSADIKIAKQKALNDSSTCKCAFAGTISITSEGQATVNIS